MTTSILPSGTSTGSQLPAFDVRELAPRSSSVCVLIPVLNEGTRILAQLERMRQVEGIPDIVITDGGSSDGSMELAGLRDRGVRTLLVKRAAGRVGTQLRIGFGYGLAEGYDGFITVDGNGKDGVDAIPRFVQALEQGYDFVQGSRFIEGGEAVNTPWVRWCAIRLLHAPAVGVAAGFAYTDTTNGFRGYSRRLLVHPDVQPFRDVFQGYEILWYLAARPPRLGLRVRELGVERAYPSGEPTPTKIRLTGSVAIVLQLIQLLLGRFNPPAGESP